VGDELFQEPGVLLGNGDRYRLKLCVIVIPSRLARSTGSLGLWYLPFQQPGQLEGRPILPFLDPWTLNALGNHLDPIAGWDSTSKIASS